MEYVYCPFCMSRMESEICPSCGRTAAYSADPTHLPAGYILEDKRNYILGAALGQGGFGVTYIAWDEKQKQKVAIKEYFPTYCSSRLDGRTVSAYRGQEETYLKGKERFLDEARMLKSLSDLKSVVNVLDFFEANNSAYLVMEYLEGMSLKDCIQRNGKLPAQQFLNQLKPLMADMEKMHRRGVVHRDIAPDNIILLPDGRLKLIDFGAARSYVGDKSMTVVVKKGFAPVEQYMRKGSNASTDVYALAATIYYCITGVVPPDSAERQYGEVSLRSPIMLGADLLPHQEGALEQALEIQPRDRLQSIEDFLKALFNAPHAVSVQPAAVVPAKEKTINPKQERIKKPRTIRPAEKKRTVGKIWIIAAVLALCVCIGIVVAGMDWTAVTETVEQLAAEQTEPVETQPEETLSPQAVKYNEAVELFYGEEYGRAAITFAKLGDYRDAKEISHKIWDAIADRDTIVAKGGSTIAVRGYGTVAACGRTAPDVAVWTDIIAVSQYWGSPLTAGLRSDGTVVVADTKDGKKDGDIPGWSDIVAIETDGFTVFGLKDDGTILTYQDAPYPPEIMSSYEADAYLKKIETLTDVVKLDSQSYFDQQSMLILTADGTVIFNFEVSRNQDIVASCATTLGIVQQKNDGTMLYPQSGYAEEQKIDVSQWRDIVSISSAYDHILGLKKDGTVVGSGDNTFKLLDVQDWTDIVAVSTSNFHSVGLKSNGTVVTCGSTRNDERRKAENWTDIKLPADRETLLSEIRPVYIEKEQQPEKNPILDPEAEKYNEAVDYFRNEEYGKAAIAFAKLGDFRDAKEISLKIWDAIAERETLSANRYHTVGLREDGTVLATGKNSYDMCDLSEWTDIIAVSAGEYHTVGLKSDGTVVAKGKPGADWVEVSDWTDIVAIKASTDTTIGLKADGTILTAGGYHQSIIREIADLQDVVDIYYNYNEYTARKSDGTVAGTFDISGWEDVSQIGGTGHGILLRLMIDGSVRADASEDWILTESLVGRTISVGDWTDIMAISVGTGHVLGIRADGTVVATGDNAYKQCEVYDWTDIVAVSAGLGHSVGLKSDGTVVSCGSGVDGKRGVKNWTNIKQPADREALLAAIRVDYITK